ncbi:alpha-L-rhamnosidase [Haloferula luteola]|uniref:Alpha-L-rhamnosidase n=1 Tax=Haloferula luteola TaxID=595692 RepID=A0A840V6P6_9BACT|nr:glycosyl hydrolase family 28 protein [Haloferula luteola]MBB5353642.1 alpha-L-rhamnosidase [Haloferula luteola]
MKGLHAFLTLLSISSTLLAREVFPITDFGARPDEPSTIEIQAAIDACADAGGGTVSIPPGTFFTGSLFLKENVDLHLEAGAILKGSQQLEDYPKRPTRIEGHTTPWRMALINASNLTQVRIWGDGTLDGDGEVFWKAFWKRRQENPRCTNLEVERPRLMFFDTCMGVTLEGIRLRNSGFWNLHLYRCQDVTVDGLDIFAPGEGSPVRAPSSDGIDIDSCQRVTVRNTRIATDDDCIALKGSKGPLADQDAASPPVEDILVEDCEFARGHGVVTLGSEATLVRNVIVRRCKVGPGNQLIRLKLRPDTPQRYENLLYEDIELQGDRGSLFAVRPWTQFFDLQGHQPPPSLVRHLTLRNVRGSYGSFGQLIGNPGDTLESITLENIDITLKDPQLQCKNLKDATAKQVRINHADWTLP